MKIFTVYDEKAEAFLPPFFLPAIGMATRSFSECVNSKDHQFGKYPHDYTLFHVGEWDELTCKFEIKSNKSLGNGVEFKEITPYIREIQNEVDSISPIQPDKKS